MPQSAGMAIIEIRELVKRFGPVEAVSGLSFDVEEKTTREQLAENHRLRFTLITIDGRKRTRVLDTQGPLVAQAA